MSLAVRLMRVMTALGLCASYEPELYFPTDKTRAMTEPIGRDGVPCMYVFLSIGTLSFTPFWPPLLTSAQIRSDHADAE